MNIYKETAYKILGKKYTWLAREYNQIVTIIYSYLHPYLYDSKRYCDTFLANNSKIEERNLLNEHIDRVIYIFWTGDNNITPNRMAGIQSLENVCGVEVKLITPKNLGEYIKEDDPLPNAYQYLSLNHKSDYLRSYFMYHYGGGYADIKTYYSSWVPAFDKLEKSDAYAIGYREVDYLGAANQGMEDCLLKRDLHYYWRHLIGNGSFICRPYTKLTEEWHAEAKRKLVAYSDELKIHPAKDIFGKNADYPILWPGMQGMIFHPLCLKYKDKLLVDNALKPSFENYR